MSRGLLILGVHVASDAYPNVLHKIQALSKGIGIDIEEINHPLAMHLLASGAPSRLARIRRLAWFALQFAAAHLRVMAGYLIRRPPASAYIPYPSVFILWMLSWLPRSRRPGRTVVDAFISLYDTVAIDRQMIAAHGLAARLLLACEKRAYHAADLVVADTRLNAERLQLEFDLPADRVTHLPLSIDESVYTDRPYRPAAGICKVLFTGTFVPLQGVEVIARAIDMLRDRPDIRFRLIGYGQSARAVEDILSNSANSNWTWETNWQSAATLADEIGAADICLGIFGAGDKTQRVWPLKNYAYMACGRPVITADTACAREMLVQLPRPSFVTVPVDNPRALADAIVALADDTARRHALATAARAYFELHLRSTASIARLLRLLQGQSDPAQTVTD